MAYILNVTETDEATAATFTVTLGLHATGDLLLVCLTQDGAATAITQSGGSDWTFLGTQAASGGCRQAWAYKIATSGSETNPTFAGSNDEWIATCLVIRDAHPTAPFGATPTSGVDFVRKDYNNVGTDTSGALTTAEDDCLLLYSWGSDGQNRVMRTTLQDSIAVSKMAPSTITHIISYRVQETAGAAHTVTMYHSVSTEGGNGWVLAIRNKSGGTLQPWIDFSNTEELYWYSTLWPAYQSVTWEAPDTFAASINGITCSSIAPPGINASPATPETWGYGIDLSSTEITAGAWIGGSHAISSTDMSGKLISFGYWISSASGSAPAGPEGVIVGFSDGTNWVTYNAASQAYRWPTLTPRAVVIDPTVAVPYASSGTLDWSAVTRVFFGLHRDASVNTVYSLRVNNLWLHSGPAKIVLGGEHRPAEIADFINAVKSWGMLDLATVQGGAQYELKLPVQIGDGTTETYFDGSMKAVAYPYQHSNTKVNNWNMGWMMNEDSAGITVNASAADTIILENGLVAASAKQYLTLDAATSVAATYELAQSYANLEVTWNGGVPCDGLVFAQCYDIMLGAAQSTMLRVSGSQATTAAVTLQDGASITDSTFIAGSESYAIEITEAGDYTLEGNAYTGYTKPIYISATTGTVTISILSSDAVPTYDTDGATVVIDQPYASLASITNLVAGSRVYIYNVTAATETYNDIVAGTSYSQGYDDGTDYTAGDIIQVRIAYHSGATAKLPVQYSAVATPTGWAILADQQDDAVYNANGIDGDTVTEFVADYPNVQIDINDPDGTTMPQRGYAWYISGQLTEDGIRYYHGAMTAEDEFNYRINAAIADMHIQNISANPVYVIGARLYRDDDTNVTVAGTGPIQMEYGRTYPLDSDGSVAAAAVWQSALEGTLTAEQMQRIMLAALAGKRSGLGTTTEEYMGQDGITPRVTFTPSDASGNGTTVVDGA